MLPSLLSTSYALCTSQYSVHLFLEKKKNDPRSHIPFHSLSPVKVEEISELQYHLIWSKVNSYLPVFFFFFPFTKTNKQKHCFWWEEVALLGNVSVADKKGRGLKVTATKLYQCFGVQENILSKNRNTFFFLAIVYFH